MSPRLQGPIAVAIVASTLALASCAGDEPDASTSEMENALPAYVEQSLGERVERVRCEAEGDGWRCEGELAGGGTVTCGAGGSADHPEFSCVE